MFEHSKLAMSCKRFCFSAVDNVVEALLKWFTTARSQNIPIGGPILQSKTEDLAEKLGPSEFKASNGWLERFKGLHVITFKSVCGKAASIIQTTVDEWVTSSHPNLLEAYHPKDVFNAD
uniref:Tigger transposable element-derived protein 4-like n=1 Tax=Saccoglossus kowalevskii TaxID=10224 RepID=A0ABM0MU87_SACKO|nr:PREDICTED: tigger transposable element-derived protein 4-like [Saccoglossus kowalevskii]